MRALLLMLLLAGVSASGQTVAQDADADVTVVSGKLAHHWLTDELFHIGDLWMQVAPNTQFHRWLSQGINRGVAIILTRKPDTFGDRDNARILRGTMMHGTSPRTSPIVHIMFLKDELTGSVGAVTFETDDPVLARTFDAFDDGEVGIIIEIR